MKITLGTNLSKEAMYARDTTKGFISIFEPYFKQKLIEEHEYALTQHNQYAADSINFYNEIAIRGGKRIRGSLVYFTYKMLGGTNEQAALDLARAIEMMHAFLLVLDDWTDKSTTRRGGPTAHEIAEEYFTNSKYVRNDPYHFGRAVSLTAGILENFRVQEVIMGLPIDAEKRIEICKNLNSKLATTGYGQLTDILNSLTPNVREKDVLDMIEWKTGNYTFENPVHAGAIMANATPQELKILTEYAIPVGIAFQIHDDVIGMFGDSAYTGKSNTDDLAEGKMTLLMQHILQNGTPAQIEVIHKHIGNRNVTQEQHEEVKQVLIESGSFEYSEQVAKNFVEKGKKALLNAPADWSKDGIDFLNGVADYIIQRAH